MAYSENKGILILGASGLIGRYLFNLLKEEEKVIGTYTNNKIRDELIHFDLISSQLSELPLSNTKYCVICSAITKFDECKENPDYSHKVNVEGIERIVTELDKRGIVSVFLSSGTVFDGINGGYKEEDKKNPISVYGKQKAEVEDFITSNIKEYLIIRPGKVFGIKRKEGVLFSEWLWKYQNNEDIFCAYDEQLPPHYAGDVARSINILLEKEARGIYNTNPPEHYSRFDMAKNFFNYLGIKDAKIIRCSIDNFNFSETKRARNPYLDASKFIGETGFIFTKLEDCFEMILRENENKKF